MCLCLLARACVLCVRAVRACVNGHRWPVVGVARDGSRLVELVTVAAGGQEGCSAQGFALLAAPADGSAGSTGSGTPPGPCSGDAAQVNSGVGMCGCGATRAALGGVSAPAGSLVALWVRPPAVAPATRPVHMVCDLATHGGGWTTVFASGGIPTPASVVDADSSPGGLALRAYAAGTAPFLQSAVTVLLAVRASVSGPVLGTAVATMPMPAAWRTAHPSTAAGSDLHNWPVSVGAAGPAVRRTVRFGVGSVATVGGGSGGSGDGGCGGEWLPASAGGVYYGLVCVEGEPSAPVWRGWATAYEADECSTVAQSASASGAGGEAGLCSSTRVFTLSVRA